MNTPTRGLATVALCFTLSFAAGLAACRYREQPVAPVAAALGNAAPAPATALCAPRPGAFKPPATLADWAEGAVLFDDLGSYHRGITTRSDEAQRFFDQGMRLVWGFNHDEATRAFVKAAQLDPDCAACWWGAALTLGPNYNFPMLPDRAQAAWDALVKARATAPRASAVEQALIAALATRYPGPEPLEPPAAAPFNEAYAQAMGEVARQYPKDDDVQVMYAEALMTTRAWNLWTLQGEPADVTPQVMALLEQTLAHDPEHPGANHYYIHTMEASPHPEKAEPSAERLAGLMQGAGHIVHMPAHIFQRVGRYADAEAANRGGAAADIAYMQRVTPQGYYGFYLAHNFDFEAFSASMRGRSAQAVAAQRKTIDAVPVEILDGMPGLDFFVGKVSMVQVRFGLWEQALAEPPPDDKYAVWTGMHRFARAYALAATGRVDEAQRELDAYDAYLGRLPAELYAGYNPAREVLGVGAKLVAARIAQAQGRSDDAIAALTAALEIEDRLAYDEPDDWFIPVRHYLGAALLQAGRAAPAEAVYREDLRRHPANGWALYGLAQALKAQGRDASATESAFATAWQDADVSLKASVF